MKVPDPDESVLKGAERPVTYNPFSDITRAIDEARELVEEDIERLRLARQRRRRRQPPEGESTV